MLRWAEVNLDRLFKNYREVEKLSKGKGIFAVVKANAYGHGSVEVARFLQSRTNVSGFAVATYGEGAELLLAGIERPILVMSSTVEEGKDFLKEPSLIPVVYDFKELSLVKELNVPFHVKVDTGMGRLGFLKEEWGELLSQLKGSKVKGVMTHFCCAEERREITEKQLDEFKSFVRELQKLVPEPLVVHAENSAALSLKLNSVLTHCRVGLALYGSRPTPSYPAELEQVMEVKAKVLTVKELPPGYSISYSATYTTKGRERIAVIAFGYADGYPRELSNRGKVLIEGKECPVRGRVCMDMLITSVPEEVKKGSVATLFGKGLTFEEVARECRTIPYELMCRISQRVERVYRGV
ncbi:alanine racemase [Thermovibrio guaymasensis]|uniref:Alanine racemase n=1 Tax=Thermovibrio guaymasensis TaxID=240167 RepID=A0A420W7Q9_9BACT|nr:alanine racemase [Thermovibrio guaymasensis]RKQ63343.1 alanine racemase [Thermovibrio guaymasensis]